MAAVTGLCDAVDVGIKTVFDPRTGLFTIVPYLGNDSQVVFSREYENIIEQIFTQSVVDYASFALVAGERRHIQLLVEMLNEPLYMMGFEQPL